MGLVQVNGEGGEWSGYVRYSLNDVCVVCVRIRRVHVCVYKTTG